jgi:hypothetical protein
MLVPRCGSLAVSFLPQMVRFLADFWAGGRPPPNKRHASAIPLPQILTGG